MSFMLSSLYIKCNLSVRRVSLSAVTLRILANISLDYTFLCLFGTSGFPQQTRWMLKGNKSGNAFKKHCNQSTFLRLVLE